jgi:hypothetical protein
MTVPRPARRLLAAIALAVALGTTGVLAVPSAALAAPGDVPVAIAPEEGAFVEPGTVVLEWTAVEAPAGYEVTWSADGADPGTASTAQTSVAIDIEGGSFSWQVRALPDGAWSTPASFHADIELPTLAVPEQQPATAPVATGPQGLETIPGGVWIGGALGFSAVFLVVVVIQSRLRREQDA